MFKKWFKLSDKGAHDLKMAVLSCTLADLTMMVPFFVIIQIISTLLAGSFGIAEVSIGRLWALFGLGIVAALVYAYAYSIEYDRSYTVAYKEAGNTRVGLAEHMRKLPMSFFNRKDISELSANLMQDCSVIETVLSHVTPQLFGHSIAITIISLMIAIFDWRMAVAIYCTLPIALAIVLLSRKAQQRFGRKLVDAKYETGNLVQEYLEGIKVVKAFGLGGAKSERLEAAFNKQKSLSIKFELYIGLFITTALIVLQIGIGIVIFAGAYFFTRGSLDLLYFIAFIIIAVRIYSPLIVIMELLPLQFYLLMSTERMMMLYNTKIMTGDEDFTPENNDIVLEDISFAYNEEPVINNVSLNIKDSAIVAFVGPSGSGKSTISRLIARFWDVDKGCIGFGGRNIKEIDPEPLMKHMSFVFQDVVLFNDSVFNNISIGKLGATREEVIAAAKSARCDGFINRLPDGYESLIGENGCRLSGGERQRISIARAILKDAPVVLLDEATAALDPENETEVQKALSRLVQGKTIIVIAHRLRTIVGVDTIFVLDEGRLVQQGSHKKLMEEGGLYAGLYNTQQLSQGWTF